MKSKNSISNIRKRALKLAKGETCEDIIIRDLNNLERIAKLERTEQNQNTIDNLIINMSYLLGVPEEELVYGKKLDISFDWKVFEGVLSAAVCGGLIGAVMFPCFGVNIVTIIIELGVLAAGYYQGTFEDTRSDELKTADRDVYRMESKYGYNSSEANIARTNAAILRKLEK